ncbi:MAG: Mut7-C RNAse domain-containing protein [candidate division WOR-3 bacterium]|nr:Mut7-C RNAse domain-containing protein [candidate division WOR-3 bacterium]
MAVKFVVDFMLGKLAKRLRMLGVDTKYLKPEPIESYNPLTLLKISREENRVVLTRNSKLKNYPNVYFIISSNVDEQFKGITKDFGLDKLTNAFTRCLECNELLAELPKSEVKGKVPFYIYQTKDKFALCKNCNKIYWQGSHYKNMSKQLKSFFRES